MKLEDCREEKESYNTNLTKKDEKPDNLRIKKIIGPIDQCLVSVDVNHHHHHHHHHHHQYFHFRILILRVY